MQTNTEQETFYMYFADQNREKSVIKNFLPKLFNLNPLYDSITKYWTCEYNPKVEEYLQTLNFVDKQNEGYLVYPRDFDKAYTRLLDTIESTLNKIHPDRKPFPFEGPLHTTSLPNLKGIFKQRQLLSRKSAKNQGLLRVDAADPNVIDKTSNNIIERIRFYFYPMTPANYRALQGNRYHQPVILVFDTKIMKNPAAVFSTMNASKIRTRFLHIDKASSMEWKYILDRGRYNRNDGIDHTGYRCAELLLPNGVSIDWIRKIYFQNEADFAEARDTLGDQFDDIKCVVSPERFAI